MFPYVDLVLCKIISVSGFFCSTSRDLCALFFSTDFGLTQSILNLKKCVNISPLSKY